MAGYIGSKASVVSSGAERKKTFTITGATTSLTGLNYTVGKVHVFQNGVRLVDGTDYTATNGTTITLTVAAQSGDNVVVISQAAFQVADALLTSGGTMTGDLSFGDNDKAIFGAGSDLQVYHSGSHSVIKDAGDGNLQLIANDFQLRNGADNANMMTGANGGAITLMHNGSQKLATTSTGIDVTGTVTSDGLTVTQTGSTTATIGATGTSGDNDGTLIINNGGTGDGMLRFDYQHLTDRARIGVSASSQNLQFYTAGNNERMRIDSSGNVGIGTSPSANLHLKSTTSGDPELRIEGSGTNNGIITFLGGGHANPAVGMRYISSGDSAGHLGFYANGSSSSTLSERMRISSSGQALINTTADDAGSGARLHITGNSSQSACSIKIGTNSYPAWYFVNASGTKAGDIVIHASSTSYNTSSDYRLKENVVDLTGASARVNQLNPSRFNFIADDTNTLVDGFLAHEVATVVPEAISGTKDAMMDEEYEVTPATGDIYTPATEAYVDDDGNDVDAVDEVIHSADAEQPETLEDGQQWRETTAAVMGTRSVPDYQGIDQSKLVPLLTAALQEALTEIASLKTRVEALEA